MHESRIEFRYIDNNVWAKQTDNIGKQCQKLEYSVNIVS